MSWGLVLKLVHVAAAIMMIAGIVGRNLTLAAAARSRDIHSVAALMPVTGVFERRMVIPGSMVVLLAGILTALAQGWPILGFLQGAPTNWVLVSLVLFLLTIPLIIFVFNPRGKIFEAALADAFARESVTPELSAAFRDPAVWLARNFELVVVFVIVGLMVLKPF